MQSPDSHLWPLNPTFRLSEEREPDLLLEESVLVPKGEGLYSTNLVTELCVKPPPTPPLHQVECFFALCNHAYHLNIGLFYAVTSPVATMARGLFDFGKAIWL